MKLATLKTTSRDGLLVIVSRDLTHYISTQAIMASLGYSATLQAALDHWEVVFPHLDQLYQTLNRGLDGWLDKQVFEQKLCESPLPRAYQWADGSAYVNHVELVRRARGAEMPESFWIDPLMYQGGSDAFLGPRDDIKFPTTEWGIDFEAEVAIVTGDVAMGVSDADAARSIRLVMLVNDVSLRSLIPAELAKGFGFFQSKPSSAFSPVAVTLDELASHWYDNKLHLPLLSTYNQKPFGKPNAGIDMTFDFAQLIAHAAKSRPLVAGTIIGSGTVSNKQMSIDTQQSSASSGDTNGTDIEHGGVGYSCIAETRMIETIINGEPSTSFMQFGDTIKIEMLDSEGNTIFGSIEQTVKQSKG